MASQCLTPPTRRPRFCINTPFKMKIHISYHSDLVLNSHHGIFQDISLALRLLDRRSSIARGRKKPFEERRTSSTTSFHGHGRGYGRKMLYQIRKSMRGQRSSPMPATWNPNPNVSSFPPNLEWITKYARTGQSILANGQVRRCVCLSR